MVPGVGRVRQVALAVAGFAFRGCDPRRWYFEFQDMARPHLLPLFPNVVFCCFHTQVETRFPAVRQAFRFVFGALLPILLKTSAMQYLPVITSALGTKPVTIHMFAPGAASESRGMLHIFRRPSLLLLSPSLSWSLHSPSSTGASPCFTHLRGHLHVSPPRHCFLSRVTPRSLPEFRCLCNVHLRSFYSRMAPVLRSASAFFLRVVWVCSSSASSC
jgi:hypothetical protein